MKPFSVSDDIVPLGKFKTNASRVLRQLHESERPVVITQHGKAAAVLVTPEEFDRLHEVARFLEAVGEGLDDSEAGRLIEDEELDIVLDKELGRRKK